MDWLFNDPKDSLLTIVLIIKSVHGQYIFFKVIINMNCGNLLQKFTQVLLLKTLYISPLRNFSIL